MAAKKAPTKKAAAKKPAAKKTTKTTAPSKAKAVVTKAKAAVTKAVTKKVAPKNKKLNPSEQLQLLYALINGDTFNAAANKFGISEESAKSYTDVILVRLSDRYPHFDWSITNLRRNKDHNISSIQRIASVYKDLAS